MKGKFFLFFFLISIIMLIVFFTLKTLQVKQPEEDNYIPQEEISEEQERMTLVTVYFMDKETKKLMPEARLIDAKLLINNPCGTLVELLLNGPKSEKLESLIPKEVIINNISVENRTAIVDININSNIDIEQEVISNSIEKTLKELSEIDSVKILINEQEIS